jgi:hypothetical protein
MRVDVSSLTAIEGCAMWKEPRCSANQFAAKVGIVLIDSVPWPPVLACS